MTSQNGTSTHQPPSTSTSALPSSASATSSIRSASTNTVSNLSYAAQNLATAASSSLLTPSSNPSVSRPESNSSTSSQQQNGTGFRVPAHKHAHHLHSIPPREKSTRTLIVDHMLWVHGRTRFSQARAELGMTDRTGGPLSPHYAHRLRPETYEESEDMGSDGEDAVTLKARAGDPGRPHNDDEDERLRAQDLGLARGLRVRAEAVERVITSMLEQMPKEGEGRRVDEEEDSGTPPTSPRIFPSTQTPGPHVLPNGVRLRLLLGTMINDLFARQAPVQSHRHRRMSISSPAAQTVSLVALPPALSSLSNVSGSYPEQPDIQPWTAPSSSLRPGPGPLYPVQPRTPPAPSARVRTLYNAGADPSTANAPPAFRCPRHLHTGCEICVEAKASVRVSTKRGAELGSTKATQYWKAMPGGLAPEGGGISGWLDGSGIGSGLTRAARTGTVLRRGMHVIHDDGCGVGNTKLSELIPRFLRLSAMVAAEMGREARGEEEEPAAVDDNENENNDLADADGDFTSPEMVTDRMDWQGPPEMEPLPPPASPIATPHIYNSALLPSREWYLLLAGLLTRAVLEGYLTAGWRGPDAVDCLLKVGLGMHPPLTEPKDDFAEFNPDELPSLPDAVKMLFPTLRNPMGNKGLAEEEFEMEMETRLRRFYDIPPSTPDLSTHMEDLAWQYPAEPVERAAVRFCEAIEKWRGKPELETYKKKGHSVTAGPVRSTRKPSIDVYFTQPFRWVSNKRRREEDGEEVPAAKVPKVNGVHVV
ncbi:unnamed protein product [Mycena citricolor]|uniref:Uncharacterized protein n=2 Tax=Mycena citricolor TaxID=2018698 RepID=A0AAD2H518_9AGAR|nr:unnamed protein product [Mycena citricolor]CAK5269464.1 unnamed protein product [Mycena citricolor]CAK5269688.1 unnamed protein product [Mycena citricolor]